MQAPQGMLATDQNLISLIGLQLLLLMGSVLLGFALSIDDVAAICDIVNVKTSIGSALLVLSLLAAYRTWSGSRAKALLQAQLILFSVCIAAPLMAGVNAIGNDALQGRGVMTIALLCAASAILITRVLKDRFDSALSTFGLRSPIDK